MTEITTELVTAARCGRLRSISMQATWHKVVLTNMETIDVAH
jgi:hypothetical protein